MYIVAGVVVDGADVIACYVCWCSYYSTVSDESRLRVCCVAIMRVECALGGGFLQFQ
jgi:hypothetical protein